MSEQTKLDLSKPVQTRDGRPVRVLCKDRNALRPIVGLVPEADIDHQEIIYTWLADGRYSETVDSCGSDIINTPPRRVKREGWVNLYRENGEITTGEVVYASYDEAHPCGFGGAGYIATIRIEWEEDEAQP